MTKGERAELELLATGPQPAYVGHQNRARSGVQMRLCLRDRFARFQPKATAAETVEITEAGLAALEVERAKPRSSRSLAARAERAGVSVDVQRRADREKRRESMSPAEKERFDMREPRRRSQ